MTAALCPQPTVLVGRRTPTFLRALPRPRNVWPGKPATRRDPSPPPAPLTGPRAVTANGVETVWLPAASVTRSSSVRLPAIAGDGGDRLVLEVRARPGPGEAAAGVLGRCRRVVVLGRDHRRVGGVRHVDELGAADADVVCGAEGHGLVARAGAGRQQPRAGGRAPKRGRGAVGDRHSRAVDLEEHVGRRAERAAGAVVAPCSEAEVGGVGHSLGDVRIGERPRDGSGVDSIDGAARHGAHVAIPVPFAGKGLLRAGIELPGAADVGPAEAEALVRRLVRAAVPRRVPVVMDDQVVVGDPGVGRCEEGEPG